MSLVFQNIDPHHPLSPASFLGGGGGGHTRRAERGEGNILEDERHRIALLQYVIISLRLRISKKKM
jgi:hypothetical protein